MGEEHIFSYIHKFLSIFNPRFLLFFKEMLIFSFKLEIWKSCSSLPCRFAICCFHSPNRIRKESFQMFRDQTCMFWAALGKWWFIHLTEYPPQEWSIFTELFWFLLFDTWISTSGTTSPCCVWPLMPLWTPTSSWALCLPPARSCPTTTSATSLDGDLLPVSWFHHPSVHPLVKRHGSVFSVKLNVSYLSSSTLSSRRLPLQPAEAGLPSRGWLRGLLQKWLVGRHCQDHHGVWWWRYWGWMQRESPAAWSEIQKSCTHSNGTFCLCFWSGNIVLVLVAICLSGTTNRYGHGLGATTSKRNNSLFFSLGGKQVTFENEEVSVDKASVIGELESVLPWNKNKERHWWHLARRVKECWIN